MKTVVFLHLCSELFRGSGPMEDIGRKSHDLPCEGQHMLWRFDKLHFKPVRTRARHHECALLLPCLEPGYDRLGLDLIALRFRSLDLEDIVGIVALDDRDDIGQRPVALVAPEDQVTLRP